MRHAWLYSDQLQVLKGEPLSFESLISASAVPHCGTERRKKQKKNMNKITEKRERGPKVPRLCSPTVGDFPRRQNSVQTPCPTNFLRRDYTNRGPPCVYTYAKRSHTHVKDPVAHVRVRWIMETHTHTKKKKKIYFYMDSATLWQLAFPEESNPNSPWEKSPRDNKLKKVKSNFS